MPLSDRLRVLKRYVGPSAKPDAAGAFPAEPRPLPEPVRPAVWPRFVNSLASDSELLLLGSVLAGLCGWFLISLQTPEPAYRGPAARSVPAAPVATEEPYVLVSARARDWLLPAMLAFEPRPPQPGLQVATSARPLVTASVEQHALMAEPLFDPLGSVVFKGLPASSRLSAGAELTEPGAASSDWAVAFSDLDRLTVVLPRNRTEPIRTTLDLRTRAGVRIAVLNVEIREEAEELASPKSQKKLKVRPAKSSQKRANSARPAVRASAPIVVQPTYPGDAPKVGPPAGAQPPSGVASALTLGNWSPDPKDTVSSGLPAHMREDPRFTTLRGLGMPPADPVPPVAVPALPP